VCLATVVQVEGSAYRKPGARMLVTSGGERAGTISGGCLESEVSRKAWWLTSDGARVQRYASFIEEDGGAPYGLGCGGTVSLLLEQGEPVDAVLGAMERVLRTRRPEVVVTALDPGGTPAVSGPEAFLPDDAARGVHRRAGTFAVLAPAPGARPAPPWPASSARRTGAPAFEVMYSREPWAQPTEGILTDGAGSAASKCLCDAIEEAAQTVFETRESRLLTAEFHLCPPALTGPAGRMETAPRAMTDPQAAWFLEYLAPPPAVTLFGAGDDAQPIAELAHTLGWRVTVVDGRAHLARRERFPHADEVRILDYADPALRPACGMAWGSAGPDGDGGWRRPDGAAAALAASASLPADEIAVILTHSYEQDRILLQALLPRHLLYLGILGPRHRTGRLLAEVAPSLGLSVEEGFARLHSPVGLDLGAGDPAAVALSIVAGIQAVLHGRSVAITRSRMPTRGAERMAGADPDARRDDDERAAASDFATAEVRGKLA